MQVSFKSVLVLLLVAAPSGFLLVDSILIPRVIKECEKSFDGLLARIEPTYLWTCLNINSTDFSYKADESIRVKINDVASKVVEPANIITINVPLQVDISAIDYYWQKYDQDGYVIEYRKIDIADVCRVRNKELLVIELAENLNSSSTGTLGFSVKSSIAQEETLMSKLDKRSAFVYPTIQSLLPIFNDEKLSTVFNVEFSHDAHIEVTSSTCEVTERHFRKAGVTVSVIYTQEPIHLSKMNIGLRRV